jgi:hypothetical protein
MMAIKSGGVLNRPGEMLPSPASCAPETRGLVLNALIVSGAGPTYPRP